MALKTERAHVRQITFSASFGYRNNVIRIPQRLPAAGAPFRLRFAARAAAQPPDMPKLRHAIQAAKDADPVVTSENLLPEVAGIGPQPPLLDAPVGAKSEPACRHFQTAPAAQATPVASFRKNFTIRSPARHRALAAHDVRIKQLLLKTAIFLYRIYPLRHQTNYAMGFLDNLENSLKSLESNDERSPADHQRREDDRARALAAAPWAEKLKNSSYTRQLFDKAALVGHRIRTKVYMAWFDGLLRLEAKQRRLELKPTPAGIVAEFIEPDGQSRMKPIDLEGDPQALIDEWLGPQPS